VFGTPFLAHLGDKYGRVYMLKRVLLVSLGCTLLMLTVARRNIQLNFLLIFLNGFVSNVRGSLSFLYGQEIVKRKDTSIYGSIYNIVDALTLTLFALYFRFLTKHWEYAQMVCLALISISCLISFGLPESPKYLI
jgi:MFS family permease